MMLKNSVGNMLLRNFQFKHIDEYLTSHFNGPVFQLDRGHRIVAANHYVLELLGNSVVNRLFSEIVVNFTDTVDLQALVKSNKHEQLLTLKIPDSAPQSYLFDFYQSQHNTLIIGQSNSSEVEILQDELLSTNKDLSNITRELHQKNRQLKQLNDFKNQMLGMAVHDIRHPLAVMKMYSSFVLDECKEIIKGHHLDFLENIKSSTLAMETILDDFLDYSVLEAGQLIIEKTEVDLVDFLRELVQSYNILFKPKKIHVQFDSELDTAYTQIDNSKMTQVINNLVNNAANYSTCHDSIKITLTQVNNSMLSIAVQDNGEGISNDDLKQIFNPFKRSQEQTQTQKKGVGLGLAIAQKIVHQHDGTIHVSSSPGAGAIFTITLPFINSQ